MNTFKIYKDILFLLTLVICLMGCDRQKLDDHLGPLLCPSENFQFTEPLNTSVSAIDFTTGQAVLISSKFNEDVAWTLTIKGSVSNATKTYTGRSKQIAINWKGNADQGLPFFTDETCVIELTLSCSKGITTSLAIQANNFNNFGYLLQNFDGIGKPTVLGAPGGTKIVAASSGIKNTPLPPSSQGGNYYSMVGQSSVDTWYFGGTYSAVNFPATIDTESPSNVYYNAFVQGNGTKNSLLTVTFRQGSVNKNYNINPNWEGWKMVSFKLSDAGVTDVALVNGMDYSLGTALTQGRDAEVHIDFIIVTTDAPFYDL